MTLTSLLSVLDSPNRWVKGLYAANHNGVSYEIVSVESPKANCFCLSGAIQKCCGLRPKDLAYSQRYRLLCKAILLEYRHRVSSGIAKGVVEQFNDHPDTTFEEVQEVIRIAGV